MKTIYSILACSLLGILTMSMTTSCDKVDGSNGAFDEIVFDGTVYYISGKFYHTNGDMTYLSIEFNNGAYSAELSFDKTILGQVVEIKGSDTQWSLGIGDQARPGHYISANNDDTGDVSGNFIVTRQSEGRYTVEFDLMDSSLPLVTEGSITGKFKYSAP